jgi:hypothetical protein
VADVWGTFKGVDLGEFKDIASITIFADLGEFKDVASITIFADHVVPAVLQH